MEKSRRNILIYSNHLDEQSNSVRRVRKSCNFQDLWLIPGHADSSCTGANAKNLIEIDSRNVSIIPAVIKFPGCFTVEIKNIRINDYKEIFSNSLFAKTEYQWINLKEFSNLNCQNASSNGCGGYGNNCYYCDICQSLKENENFNNASASKFYEQFRGLSCPHRPGYYTFRKEFCFNDWSAFDANKDCEFDVLNSEERTNLKSALSSLQQIGYGTIVAKIRLAYNATQAIVNKKLEKERKIELAVKEELNQRNLSWNINKSQYDRFHNWYINYRKDLWHKEEYLPWLLYENEISCLRLTFNICERVPRLQQFGGRNGQQKYTCD